MSKDKLVKENANLFCFIGSLFLEILLAYFELKSKTLFKLHFVDKIHGPFDPKPGILTIFYESYIELVKRFNSHNSVVIESFSVFLIEASLIIYSI